MADEIITLKQASLLLKENPHIGNADLVAKIAALPTNVSRELYEDNLFVVVMNAADDGEFPLINALYTEAIPLFDTGIILPPSLMPSSTVYVSAFMNWAGISKNSQKPGQISQNSKTLHPREKGTVLKIIAAMAKAAYGSDLSNYDVLAKEISHDTYKNGYHVEEGIIIEYIKQSDISLPLIERESALKIIAAIVMHSYRKNISKPNTVAKEIAADTEKNGYPVSTETIVKYLTEAAQYCSPPDPPS